ncbi:3-carboxy-cis,cis-mucoante lactonizing enzyme [Coprinopsis marcescibilis]|uniref:3-carboxy-cis,cis-mucoante lactonizing enzyme n=1 Tax=Coprinopsis marcescibilis TaxID=230819 RepID=A0A5C3KHE0_COPMA|nr:3-carboxy-cis,cis-mucoante lactonizing enzyme [Coprinopsis marcescibilis]
MDAVPGATATDAMLSIVAGSFRSLSLVLLVFSPLNRTLHHVETVPAFGPHQYLATTPRKDYVYTTSWATPPILSSWRVERKDDDSVVRLSHMNTVPITATSSYINIPPPYDYIYSAGGPTGEVHEWDPTTGGFGRKVQQFLFVPEEELDKADKTRVALRYGSHGVEFSSLGYAFIPVLGTDSIEMYRSDAVTGKLVHISSNYSPRGTGVHDGPRHVKIHPNGKVLYCVAEHTNYLDIYDILADSLQHVSSHSILPRNLSVGSSTPASSSADPHLRSKHRGGTLLLTPSTPSRPAPVALLTTTRGATSAENGWLSIFRLDKDGYISAHPPSVNLSEETQHQHPLEGAGDVVRFETPTSSGKANALDVRLKHDGDSNGVWILLTDDDKKADERGAVRVLEWDGWESKDIGVRVVAEWPSPDLPQLARGGDGVEFTGASHALWLD